MTYNTTIFALSTPYFKSAIALVRISGFFALDILSRLSNKDKNLFKPRVAYSLVLMDEKSDVIDHVVSTYFQAPKSFTGEDLVELSCHGSIAVIHHLLEYLSAQPELRLAEPGEFTKRAFINGKMDLLQVEGLADLIDSENKLQKKIAVKQVLGITSKLYRTWREKILHHLAYIEALIDFPEDDIPTHILGSAIAEIEALGKQMERLLQNSNAVKSAAHGVNIAIFGPPNAGKSSIINMLTMEDTAIISEIAGTTRDIVRARVLLEGVQITFCDTAGIRSDTHDIIESEGIKRAIDAVERANLRICVLDISTLLDINTIYDSLAFLEYNNAIKIDILILNKVDLMKNTYNSAKNLSKYMTSYLRDHFSISVEQIITLSAIPNQDIQENRGILVALLLQILQSETTLDEEDFITNMRQHSAIQRAKESLERFVELCKQNMHLDVCSAELRLATQEIQCIIGEIATEDILNEVFSRFCIGK